MYWVNAELFSTHHKALIVNWVWNRIYSNHCSSDTVHISVCRLHDHTRSTAQFFSSSVLWHRAQNVVIKHRQSCSGYVVAGSVAFDWIRRWLLTELTAEERGEVNEQYAATVLWTWWIISFTFPQRHYATLKMLHLNKRAPSHRLSLCTVCGNGVLLVGEDDLISFNTSQHYAIMCLRINSTDDHRWCHCGNLASILPFSITQTTQEQGAVILWAHISMHNIVFTPGIYCELVLSLAVV